VGDPQNLAKMARPADRAVVTPARPSLKTERSLSFSPQQKILNTFGSPKID
jgi:hypothetical protein